VDEPPGCLNQAIAELTDFFNHLDPTDRVRHPETRALLVALAELLDRLQPATLDRAGSYLECDDETISASLVHAADEARNLAIVMFGDEAVVSYGEEHEHFRSDHVDELEQVGPLATPGMVPKLVAFLEALMTGRIELHVWNRPMWVRTRSYWINDAGTREIFLRGGTLLPSLRWSGPRVRTFDFG